MFQTIWLETFILLDLDKLVNIIVTCINDRVPDAEDSDHVEKIMFFFKDTECTARKRKLP